MVLQSINPASESVIETFEEHTEAQVEEITGAVEEAWRGWRGRPFAERAERMRAAAGVLRARRDILSRTMSLEMGKAIREAQGEIEKCAWVCEWYADNAAAILAPEHVGSGYRGSYVRFDPIGPVFAIMPWNFPFWQVFRFAAPALMAGNAGILKHASNVSRCALEIEEVFAAAGFPQNLFRTLLIKAGRATELIAHPAVRAVTLTGSDAAGRQVGAAAGKAIKKSVLELGGSDPFIVLAGADLRRAAAVAATARLINCGQSCIAAKRFIVDKRVIGEFLPLFRAEMEKKKMGDPLDPATDLGPLARPDLRDDLEDQVKRSVAAGARVELGGKRPGGKGAFFPPTVLTGVRRGMAAFDEEVFGPVAAVVEAEGPDHALELANDTLFGLGASLWTDDAAQAAALAARIDAGAVFVNDMVKSDPRLPFGGVKASGYGRELSHHGIREFVNIKTVVEGG